MNNGIPISKKYLPTPALERACRTILYFLVTTLVFEGIIRKLVPSVVSTVIFFIKDFICLIAFYLIYDKYSYSLMFTLKKKWVWVSIAFIPLLIYAFLLDPPLSAFAAKQYLLYTVVALLMQYCFYSDNPEKLRRFLFYFSLLLLPTVAIAMLQNALPGSSWLNQSVGGGSLEAFSAGGYLRVSSTFSFTGQYSWYLNISCPMIITYIVLSSFSVKKIGTLQWMFWLLLLIAYIISIFITGGRTAVLGAGAVVGIGFVFLMLKRPLWVLSNGIFFILGISILLGALQSYKPEYFAAYTERSSGHAGETHEQEVQTRVTDGLFDWTTWVWKEDFSNIILGNGLGIMSNGSDQLSSYARSIRSSGFWTESDSSTILWEGGFYLAIVWYAFRISMVIMSFRIYWSFKDKRLNFAGAFLAAYILIGGFFGALSMQPPIAIWWWLAIGTLVTLKKQEEFFLQKQKNKTILQDVHSYSLQ